ncbi:MAG: GGDEF domain-containing protein [Proteobacteria bacterium]|nr:GGDEF domain-containing protein [Pseudomonadota bacterium]
MDKTVVTVISRTTQRPAAREACLVAIYGHELGKKYNLDAPVVIVGRSSKSDIQIDQDAVSRSHCKIVNDGERVTVYDLGSTNGTYVNDRAIQEHVLTDGEHVKIGRAILKFLSGGNVEHAYHEEIYRLTTVDGLTQVYNRRYFMETLERELSRSQRYARDLSLIMFDIDHFKSVNDSFGHLAGDHVLKHLALAVKAQIRREDVMARYGGEEFAVLLPEIDAESAHRFAEKIRALVEQTTFMFEATAIQVTVSVGVASLTAAIVSADALVKLSDERLYEAKRRGRNFVCSATD